ncbi:hypothetical protein HYE60_00210 [Aggregatibacter actinomycetemcomitans]|uniref:hypothetical protein n=1 Tax=Aggregatibacter actinomycetemcomitans TaxID=714 RepID=UPI00197C0A80|nr:hypothetical protein [Aggregatibacter actinomycetemcomitans]MBN6073714.1 hypothetical protein [Aggregatibacter actinomycetemcomitans]
MIDILKKFVDVYKKTDYLLGIPEFSEKCIEINSQFLNGELLEYYQHIDFKEKCYFGNEYFCLVLMPYLSKGTTSEDWALQDFEEFSRQEYIIFASTDIDEIIFCDMKSKNSPVYGGVPGDSTFYKLSDSLTEFVQLYITLTELQLENEFEDDFEFKERGIPLVDKYISPSAQETCKAFIFH